MTEDIQKGYTYTKLGMDRIIKRIRRRLRKR
jgi:hypothetical protein